MKQQSRKILEYVSASILIGIPLILVPFFNIKVWNSRKNAFTIPGIYLTMSVIFGLIIGFLILFVNEKNIYSVNEVQETNNSSDSSTVPVRKVLQKSIQEITDPLSGMTSIEISRFTKAYIGMFYENDVLFKDAQEFEYKENVEVSSYDVNSNKFVHLDFENDEFMDDILSLTKNKSIFKVKGIITRVYSEGIFLSNCKIINIIHNYTT